MSEGQILNHWPLHVNSALLWFIFKSYNIEKYNNIQHILF